MSQQPHPVREISGPNDFAAAFSVSRETLERLKTYEALLQKWQKTINLVAPSTLNQIWHRHFADSAQILAIAPPKPQNWVDLGSGAGFPGLVIAILLAENGAAAQKRVTLVESDSRKAAFLREVARAVALPVDIVAQRIEVASTRIRVATVDVVSARALAPLDKLLELTQPLMQPATTALFLKGRDVSREVQDAEIKWKFEIELTQSLTDPDARIVRITNLSRRTPTPGANP